MTVEVKGEFQLMMMMMLMVVIISSSPSSFLLLQKCLSINCMNRCHFHNMTYTQVETVTKSLGAPEEEDQSISQQVEGEESENLGHQAVLP